MPCGRCGDTHARCAGHRRDGQPCTQWPIRGLDKCKMHAGRRTAEAQDEGRHRQQVEAARQTAVTYGLPVEVDPAEGLLDEVARTYGHVLFLLAKVREQDPDSLVWGVTEEAHKHATEFPGVDTTYQAKPNAWLRAYREERSHFVKVCTDTLKAGVEERRVRLAEVRGEQLATYMRALAKAWDVPDTPETWEAARVELECIDGGAA